MLFVRALQFGGILQVKSSKAIAAAEELLKLSTDRNVVARIKLGDGRIPPFDNIETGRFGKKRNCCRFPRTRWATENE